MNQYERTFFISHINLMDMTVLQWVGIRMFEKNGFTLFRSSGIHDH